MSRLGTARLFIALSVVAAATVATAQQPTRMGLVPLDQGYEDRDPLRHSLRRVNQGLGVAGQESYVYRRPGDDNRIYYVRPGITASYDRSEYFRPRKGPLLQMIPPNTVFYIGGPPPPPSVAVRAPSPLMVQAQVDARVGGAEESIGAATDSGNSPIGRYLHSRRLQQRALMEAIDRAVADASAADAPAQAPAQLQR